MSNQRNPASGTCRAAVFSGTGIPLELREFPLPVAAAGEAVVKIDCCTLCGSDLHTIRGTRTEPTPSILGHEVLGHVVSLGEPPLQDIAGQDLQVGDRVTWSPAVSCGTCDRCDRGLPQKCRKLHKYGHAVAEGEHALSGGLAEYIVLQRGSAVAKLGDSIADDVACPVNCATATVAAAFRTAGDVAGRRVLIMGAGLLGLTGAAFAATQSAAHITVCDPEVARLELAKKFGASSVVRWHDDPAVLQRQFAEASGSDRFDLVLELSGAASAVECCLRTGDIGAQIVLVGSVMDSADVALNPTHVVRNWLSIHGVHNYAPEDLLTAVTFLEQHHAAFPFADIVARSFPLAEINEAIDFALRERPIRVAVKP